jgi:general secretion pathway protein M
MNNALRLNRNSMTTAASVAGYLALIMAAIAVTWWSLSTMSEQRASLAAAQAMLDRLEGRLLGGRNDDAALMSHAPPGSAFIEGQNQNVAGAALLQRIATAVHQVGGTVISSQVDIDGPRAKDGWVGLIVSCELDQPALQQLLYDVEADMPFLFVDQLTVQTPKAGAADARISVVLGVSGQWWRGK